MTPQLVDHTHTDSRIVIGCNLVQSRATSQKNEHVYFWLQSHRSRITYSHIVNNAPCSLSLLCVCVCVCVFVIKTGRVRQQCK